VDVDCWKFYGDPIYDIDLDDSREENAEISPLKQPSLVSALSENSIVKLRVGFLVDNSKFFQIREHIVDNESA
jgi:hypothetical protein